MNKTGYILIETLVSVVILAIGLTFVLNAVSSEINALRTSKNYTHAGLLLEEKICELEKEGGIDLRKWPEGRESGEFPDERFSWEVDITHMYDEQNLLLGIVEVTVTVKWRELLLEQELSTTTYMRKL